MSCVGFLSYSSSGVSSSDLRTQETSCKGNTSKCWLSGFASCTSAQSASGLHLDAAGARPIPVNAKPAQNDLCQCNQMSLPTRPEVVPRRPLDLIDSCFLPRSVWHSCEWQYREVRHWVSLRRRCRLVSPAVADLMSVLLRGRRLVRRDLKGVEPGTARLRPDCIRPLLATIAVIVAMCL